MDSDGQASRTTSAKTFSHWQAPQLRLRLAEAINTVERLEAERDQLQVEVSRQAKINEYLMQSGHKMLDDQIAFAAKAQEWITERDQARRELAEMREALLFDADGLEAQADDMVCDAGNPDGGSTANCLHCQLTGRVRQLRSLAGAAHERRAEEANE